MGNYQKTHTFLIEQGKQNIYIYSRKAKTFKNIINKRKKNIYIFLIVVKENPRTPIIRICAQNHPV